MPEKILSLRINCKTCVKRSICTGLCKSAEKYADQDRVELRERILEGQDQQPYTIPIQEVDQKPIELKLSERQICIVVLQSCGVPNQIIKAGLNLTDKQMLNSEYKIRLKINKSSL